ncbi:YlbF family regulator [Macrococcus equipercicus]|uniref:YlbF family regulator n=1 Tax=Macrococcus equipercicus TaxID=69967 RepID=A0A9Q9F292_9STAP|nr:YlbF family regulator [Macrococcus equipercicus]KAA1042694.1 YlbF family regulator [Macrococcus equipercicus]UTH14560.1 YlbF family regulator [Macrococcus equipercicus]
MVYDETIFELLDYAEGINRMILSSESYINYRNNTLQMQCDPEVERLRKRFIRLKERYDEVMRFGRYHPDYMEVMLETRRAKKAYDLHPMVAAAKQAETALQTLLDEVIVSVSAAVSSEIKVDRGNPFFTADHQCGGGCSCSA